MILVQIGLYREYCFIKITSLICNDLLFLGNTKLASMPSGGGVAVASSGSAAPAGSAAAPAEEKKDEKKEESEESDDDMGFGLFD
ncbi:hypothetical protein GDO86_008641 [Hymenochirus boettgeri]|uniref:Uncharacterized protein n=1 Tax=Hymenochirus boettgeri TaxID=247094 RepID=A0A8T2J2I3_9PIPI|nr:hypothetical protein GDO86_008641 [Hymenochirus boettgeri]